MMDDWVVKDPLANGSLPMLRSRFSDLVTNKTTVRFTNRQWRNDKCVNETEFEAVIGKKEKHKQSIDCRVESKSSTQRKC
ncbi:hypothetical protein LZ30DRAFT_164968 [Colletotrichum cereale]|nr:hypothetical protein LZ30DRAFT_164968 [Colletotrichum cereale]